MDSQNINETIDNCLCCVIPLLNEKGIVLKQKGGYKAGKLTATRNWCHIIDSDSRAKVIYPDSCGRAKQWILFARFDSDQPPLWPWEKVERCDSKARRWVITGDDVWGIACEELERLVRKSTNRNLVNRLGTDLQKSFHYSRQRYC